MQDTLMMARVFLRSSAANLHSFNQTNLASKEDRVHLFIPWSNDIHSQLMYKIKAMIKEKGHCYIPYMQRDGASASIELEKKDLIRKQIIQGKETHLYMSNFDSIHVLKATDLLEVNKIKKADNKYILDLFLQKKQQYQFWIRVDDIYVYQANHEDDSQLIVEKLNSLIFGDLQEDIFNPVQHLEVKASPQKEVAKGVESPLKWIDANRSLTYDYFINSCELEDNIYQDHWKQLARSTQHCLVVFEQIRHKAILYRGIEKHRLLQESFEYYLSAVMNELNEIYIRPIMSAFYEYDCLVESWSDVQANFIDPGIRDVVNTLIDKKKDYLNNLDDFITYMRHAKSFLFSLRSRFAKKIGREEYLYLENFLKYQEGLVESFLCKELDKKLEGIIEVNNWFLEMDKKIHQPSEIDFKNTSSKLTHLLNIMNSANYEDNIFFRIIEEKTSKGHLKRNFEDEVKMLINNQSKNKKVA